jgi:two-component system, chemotaxis family, chemotaxis protein CheY
MRFLILKSLKSVGIKKEDVFMCDSGKSAVEILRQSPVDLMLVDWHMPEMDGLELLKYVKSSQYKHIPVIMVTVEQKKKNIEEAIKNGADDYLIKPLQEDILRKKLFKVSNRHGLSLFGMSTPLAPTPQAAAGAVNQPKEKIPTAEELLAELPPEALADEDDESLEGGSVDETPSGDATAGKQDKPQDGDT